MEEHIHQSTLGSTRLAFEYYSEGISLLSKLHISRRFLLRNCNIAMIVIILLLCMADLSLSQTSNLPNCTLTCPDSRLIACSPKRIPMSINLGVTDREVCHTNGDCYGRSSGEPDRVQQRPVNLIIGQILIIRLDPLNVNSPSKLWQFFRVSAEQFFSCTSFTSNGTLASNVTQNSSFIFNSSDYGLGRHYFAGNINNILSCSLGLRISITVKAENCAVGESSGSLCSSKGICIAAQNESAATCSCCSGFNGTSCSEYDACTSNPCLNSGNCTDIAGGFRTNFSCRCTPYYTGRTCETQINYCNPTPCANNATCNNLVLQKNYSCHCLPGFTGRNCEVNINDCVGNNCTRNATCIDLVNGYRCECNGNWTGEFCSEDINECNSVTCLNNGTCTNTPGSFYCTCPVNVTGQLCETDLFDNCLSSPCMNQGICSDHVGAFHCTCLSGYTGERCQTDINECLTNPCAIEGTSQCINGPGNYTCVCLSEYTGRRCEQFLNRCASQPCLNGGLCVNLYGRYSCVCPAGYRGSNCQDVLNKCSYAPCKNNGTCERIGDFLSNYTCHCAAGWTGRNCTEDINECESNPCLNNATCRNLFNSYACLCTVGWDGTHCQTNVDACEAMPCKNNGTCSDLQTGLDYTCTCSPGFTGINCSVNIDDCMHLNANCNNGKCVDQVGTFYCNCSEGWFGKFCDTSRNMCASRPCMNEATCENVNTTSGYVCNCRSGWTGANCQTNINDCISNLCRNGATCNDFLNFYNCTCRTGYTGQYCETEINECLSMPCRNNATCVNNIGNFSCICHLGYTGAQCEININECASFPCFNNATCVDEVNRYTCRCHGGYVGVHCEIPLCRTNPCRNGATCIQSRDRYTCQCQPGYTGQNCEVQVNECASIPCQNNATCVDLVNGYQCNCMNGYTGRLCEAHLCETSVCQNNASCQRLPSGYVCNCMNGYTGQNCEQQINECLSNPCNATGSLNCTDLVGGYRCYCKAGYLGIRCDNHTCEALQPCQNGAPCVQQPSGYQCMCLAGFTGINCENNINECASDPCINGTCIDRINGYSCNCSAMYTGARCETNMNLCASRPCMNNATCENNITSLSFTCGCQGGFSGSLCQSHLCDTLKPCLNNGTCLRLPHNYSCQCEAGFTGSRCEIDINECLSAPCLNSGSCIDGRGIFTCSCPKNFTGGRCETFLDYCSPSLCINNGTCVNNYTSQTFNCQCPQAFSGRRCELHICDLDNPCQNRATCLRDVGNARCVCLPGFTGQNCSIDINECGSSPCINNGSCIDGINGFTCQCPVQYTGSRCDILADYCASNPCTNSSTCVNDYISGTYKCNCHPFRTGRNCEVYLGPCSTQPCSNNGTCIETVAQSYRCVCPFGYSGPRCESLSCPCQNNGRCALFNNIIKCICPNQYGGLLCENFYGDCRNNNSRKCIDNSFCVQGPYGYFCQCPGHLSGDMRCTKITTCSPSPCLNGATCTNTGFTSLDCACSAGYTGQFCQLDINECASNPCQNGGACLEVGAANFTCYCPLRYYGDRCQNETASTSIFQVSSFPSTYSFQSTTYVTTFFQTSPRTFITDSTLLSPPVVLSSSYLQSEFLAPSFSSSMTLPATSSTSPFKLSSVLDSLHFSFSSQLASIRQSMVVSQTSLDESFITSYQTPLLDQSQPISFTSTPSSNFSIQTPSTASVILSSSMPFSTPTASHLISQASSTFKFVTYVSLAQPSAIASIDSTHAFSSLSQRTAITESFMSSPSVSSLTSIRPSSSKTPSAFHSSLSFFSSNVIQPSLVHTSSQLFTTFTSSLQSFQLTSTTSFYFSTTQLPVSLPFNSQLSSMSTSSLITSLTQLSSALPSPSPQQSAIQSQAVNVSSNQVPVIPVSSIQSSIYMSLSSFIQSSTQFDLSSSSSLIPAFDGSLSLFSSNAIQPSFTHSSTYELTTAISTSLQSPLLSITSSYYSSTTTTSVILPTDNQGSDISSSVIPSITQTSSLPSSLPPQQSTTQSPAMNISSDEFSIMPVSSVRSSVYFSSSPQVQLSSTPSLQFQSSFYNSSLVHTSYQTAAVHSSQFHSASLFPNFSSTPSKSSLQFTEILPSSARLPTISSYVPTRYLSISAAISLQSSLISIAYHSPSSFSSFLSTLNFSVNSISLSLQFASASSTDPIHTSTTSIESPLQSLFSSITTRSLHPMASSITSVQSSFTPLLSMSVPPSNPCAPNPCLQGGNCTQLSTNRFNCSCEIGYGGERCNNLVCQCQNNGRCVRDSPSSIYRCICQVGFSGKYCENRIGDCQTQNCSGNGICRERLQGFVCVCNRGYYGGKCENFTSSCLPNPCQNSGICLTRSNETGGGFTCACPQGYQGQLCQFDYNECASSPCLNGGTCRENQINSYECYCPAWSYGTNCELLRRSSAFSVAVIEDTSLLSSIALGSTLGITSDFQSLSLTYNISQMASFVASNSLSQAESHFTSQPILLITSTSKTATSPYTLQSAESFSYSRAQSQASVSDSGFVASSLSVNRSASDTTTQGRSAGSTPLRTFTTGFSPILSSPSLLSPASDALLATPSFSLSFRTYLNSQNLSKPTADASLHSTMYHTPTMSNFATSNFATLANGSANSDWSTFAAELLSTFSPSPTQSLLYSISSSSVVPTSIPLRNLTCADNVCNGYPCYNESSNGLQFRCVCMQPSFGPRCIQGITVHFPFFNGHSYVEYAAIPFNNVINTIVLTFRTTSSNGMLLYAGHQSYRDFILLRVANGLLEFTFNAGAETVSVTASERVDTGVLMTIIATHDSRSGTGTLSINGSTPISRSSSLSFTSIQLSTPWFIGGLNSSFRPLNTSNGLPMLTSFKGCVRDMQVNTVPYRVLNAKSWLSISECDVPACERGPCRNNATCVQNQANPQDYTCQCGTGYYGKDCTEREAHCQGDPCNGGTCAWTPTGHTCLCQYGKHGSSCLSSINITRPTFNQFDNYSSYIEYPWQQTVRNADARFDIKMQFKLDLQNPKSSQNGLLAFAGQSAIGTLGDDFFALGIINNYTYLIYNLGGGLAVLRSSLKIDHSRRWHFIVAGRNGRSGYMHLDSYPAVYTTAPGLLTGLDVYSPLYLGGVPDLSKVPPIVRSYFSSGFVGTIFDASFRTTSSSFTSLLTFPTGSVPSGAAGVAVTRGLNIGDDNVNECLPNPCQNNGTCSQNGGQFICSCQAGWTGIACQDSRIPCIDYNPCFAGSICQSTVNGLSCDCQLGRMGTFCDQTVNVMQPFFKANSFMGFQRPDVKYNTKVYMRFKAAKLNGLLLYVSEKADSSSGDFFAISLWQGYVYVRFNLGLGTAVMSSRNKITLKQWHELYVERRSKEAIMRLDSYMFIGAKSPGSYTQLNVGSIVYLGGIPRLSALNPSAVKDLNSQRDFEGAVSHFIVNDIVQVYAPGRAIVGRNIEDEKRTCVLNDCQNGAKCSTPTTVSNYSYICACNLGWEGRLCNSATASYNKARFSGDGFIFYQDNTTTPVNENHIELSFNASKDGLLLLLGDLKTNNSEYLAVAIINSKLTFSINTGGGVFQMQLNQNVSDGVNHRAIITRFRQTIFLTVNGFVPVLRDFVSSDYFLSYSGHVFIGGLDESVRANAKSGFSLGFTGCIWNVKTRLTTEYLNLNKNSFNRGVNVRSCD